MDNELITEKSWWKTNWRWFIPLSVFVCVFAGIFLVASEISNVKQERENGIGFDPVKWQIKSGEDYTYRNKMLRKLVDSGQLKRLKKDGVLKLLGQPDRIDGAYLFYTISQQRIQFFPLHATTLVIKLSSDDDTVKSVMIHE